ncbi:glutathione hydrolase 1 proenzyme-like isoform X2 [Montipora foliosa]|uniref:glutathione hydrolase 1 proenzyme-like isoform X2 n=1 Tax=Montipora foliosa TaxID=591990 RepID=UPI0035F1D992
MKKGSYSKVTFTPSRRISKRKVIIIAVVVAVVVLALIIALVLILTKEKPAPTPQPTIKLPPTGPPGTDGPQPTIKLPPTGPPGADGPYQHAVVASDAGPCSEIGREILKKGGTAVDSAIAALFCIGVYNMHSAGIGGGGFMVVYNKSTNFVEVIDFREEAPGKANRTMFVGGKMNSRVGATASGVPGEVKGFHEAWKKYGKMAWKDLVQPSIDMAKNGFPFGYSAHYAATRKSVKPLLKNNPGFRELLFNEDGELKKLGEMLHMPKFARTLERIRDNPDDFYNGDLARDVVQDIQDGGGIFTVEDMRNYRAKFKRPVEGKMGNYSFFSTPPPGSGVVLSLILNILKGYNFTSSDRNGTEKSILTYHRIVEAFKFAYAYRALLGDQDFADVTEIVKNMTDPDFAEAIRLKILDNTTFSDYKHYGDYYYNASQQGTSHLSVIAENGDAVSATTTINLFFGARYRSNRTGIIYNNEMDDFSTPGLLNAYGVLPSESNMIYPGKRPQSSTAPTIFLDDDGVARLVIGASGGTKITTAISLVTMNYLWFGRTLPQAVVEPRLHHQLLPMYIRIDKDYPILLAIQGGLQRLGHEVRNISGYAVVQATARNPDGSLTGKSDPRKSGWAAGY